jgi:hypothetical protein
MAAARSPAALGLNCPVCLTLFDEPVTLQCGHSLCAACKDDLEEPKTREVDAVWEWRANQYCPVGTPNYEKFRKYVQVTPARTEAYSGVTCPSCRAESPSDALATSVQLRASIGALFPEHVQARATVKRLTAALQAARASEIALQASHLETKEEKTAAGIAAAAAEQRRAKAVAAEAKEAARLAKAAAEASKTKTELAAAQKTLDSLEKMQGGGGGKGGAVAGQKRKR